MLSSTCSNEDASVFRINDDLALVQTLDFITPLVDDPFIFGQIAAANSLSDVFAMGGEVINALNIVGFDDCHFSNEILREILRGGKDKIKECGGVLVGGHTISTPEIYYGLSVTGRVNPRKFWSNNTAREGDLLILTKPLGTGIIATAIKAEFLKFEEFRDAIDSMILLNFYAVGALAGLKIHAATDVTGFGLLGHALEMINESVSFKIYPSKIPLLKSVARCLDEGLIPAGSYKNLKFIAPGVDSEPDIALCDAQTSGGLLLAVAENDAARALVNLKNAGYASSAIIGEVVARAEHKIYLV